MASRSFPELALAVELLQQGLFKPDGRPELCGQYRYYNEHKFEEYEKKDPAQKRWDAEHKRIGLPKGHNEKDQRKCRSDNALLKQFSSNFISLGADPENKKWSRLIEAQMSVFEERIQLCDGNADEGFADDLLADYEESPHSTRPQRRQMRLLMQTARAGLPLFGVSPADVERQLTLRLLTLCGRPEGCFEDAYSELMKPGLKRLDSNAANPTIEMEELETPDLVAARRARDYAGDLVAVASTQYAPEQHGESYQSAGEDDFEARYNEEVGEGEDDKADIAAAIESTHGHVGKAWAQRKRNYRECPHSQHNVWDGMPKAFWARLLCILWDCDFDKMQLTLHVLKTKGIRREKDGNPELSCNPVNICAGSTEEALKKLSPQIKDEITERHLMTKYWHWQLSAPSLFKVGEQSS